MFSRSSTLILAIYALLLLGCTFAAGENTVTTTNTAAATPEPKPTKYVVPDEFMNAKPEELCDRLADIEVMPYKDPNDTDPIYEALIAKGKDAYPCLLNKITDATKMPDPRRAPHWQHYAVGDTAVFILVRSIGAGDERLEEKLLIEMLPPASREEWKTNGVYAYFNYVSEPKHRRDLQRWWKKWLDDNKK